MKINDILEKYYKDYKIKPYISNKRNFELWEKQVNLSKSKLVSKKNLTLTEDNLLPGEIILLWRISLDTFTTESISEGMYPKYFEYTYGIDAPYRLQVLEENGYVYQETLLNSLAYSNLVLLKNILKTKHIKGISKMKKEDVYLSIRDNFTEEELSAHIKVRKYSLTNLGELSLEKNKWIVDKHPKKKF